MGRHLGLRRARARSMCRWSVRSRNLREARKEGGGACDRPSSGREEKPLEYKAGMGPRQGSRFDIEVEQSSHVSCIRIYAYLKLQIILSARQK